MILHTEGKAIAFENSDSWRKWLQENGASEKEVWIIHFKKHTGIPSISRQEALEEALCFGWIDSLLKSIDDSSYKQKYTPRLKRSQWSERNKRLVRQLLAEGRMESSGIESIKGWIDERPVKQYVKAEPEMPPALVLALLVNNEASRLFYCLPPSQQKNIMRWVGAAKKEETLKRRISEVIASLESGCDIGMK